MSDVVSLIAGELLSGTAASPDLGTLTPDQKGMLVDALLHGTFASPPDRARSLLDLCVSISTVINSPLRLYLSLVRRGMMDAMSSPESASRDLEQAKGMLKGLGADLAGSYPSGSPVGMALSQLVLLDYLIGNGFQMEGRNDDAASHYAGALGILARVTTDGKPGESWYFERKADAEAALRSFDGAVDDYRKALAYPEGSDPRKRMNLLRSLAFALIGKGDFQGAEGTLTEAVTAAETAGDKDAEAMAYLTLANLYQNRLNRFKDAIASAEAAASAASNPETRRTALAAMSASYISLGLYSKALSCSREIATEYAGEGGRPESMAITMVAAGLSMMSRHQESLESFRSALDISLKANDLVEASDILAQIATERTLLGEYEGALSDLDKAAAMSAQIPDHSKGAKCSVLKANIYLYNLKSPAEAGKWYNVALDQLASVGSNEVAAPYQHVQALMGLSSAYLAEKDFEGALGCLNDSLEVCGDLEPLATTQAQVLKSMADVFSAQNKPDEAEAYELRAAATYRRLGMVRDEAGTYRDLSLVQMAHGDYGKALDSIQTAGKMFDAGGFRDEELSTASTAALIFFNQSRWDEAQQTIEKALANNGPDESDPTILAACYSGLSAVARKRGDGDGELTNLLKAAEQLDSLRAKLRSGDLRLGFQVNEVTVYGAIVEAFRVRGEIGRSFEYAEKSKSRVLVEDLRTADIRRPPVNEALVNEEKALLDDLRASLASGFDSRAREAEGKLKTVWDAMATGSQSPEVREYLSIRRGDSIGAAEAQLLVGDDGKTGIVEYYVLNKKLLIYLLSKTAGLKVFAVEMEKPKLEGLSRRLLGAFQDGSNDSYSGLAQEMSDCLLAPVSEAIAGLEHVHFIPHGVLHGLPLHALPLDGRPLIEHHVTSYSQSASVLRFLAEKDVAASGALVAGDSASDLPFARAEAMRLADLLGTRAITGDFASKALITSSLAGKRNLSFSCHAMFSSGDPLSSGIEMAGGEMLTARDWLTLKTSADLISLSACESAVSGERPGDEMLGMVRSMTFAGARSIVASMWRVEDIATYITVTRFYENMTAKGLDKLHALREAQLNLRGLRDGSAISDQELKGFPVPESVDFSHPYFWAPFVLMGAW